MKIGWHVLTAVPFLLTGNVAGAIACVAPDAPWAVAEARYRRWRGKRPVINRRTWHDWLRDDEYGFGALPRWVLVAYRLTHSPFMLLLFIAMCIGYGASGQHDAPWAVAVGWAVHLALDVFSHDGPLRMRWWYPLMNDTVPASWVHDAFAIDREHDSVDVVCLSGGWESTLCLLRAIERSRRTGCRVVAMFADYGQEGMQEERSRATELSYMFGVPLRVATIEAPVARRTAAGAHVYLRRNAAIIRAAVRRHSGDQPSVRAVWLGYRAPLAVFDAYGDSNAEWAAQMSFLYAVHVVSPCVGWPKVMVQREVRKAGVRDSWIYSSEVQK